MTKQEFISRALSVPWVRSGGDWLGVDCYGLVELWHKHVLGVQIEFIEHTTISDGLSQCKNWVQCEIESNAACFMAYRNGSPEHCGIVLDSVSVLHAQGGREAGGRVRVTRLDALKRRYGDIKFFRYVKC